MRMSLCRHVRQTLSFLTWFRFAPVLLRRRPSGLRRGCRRRALALRCSDFLGASADACLRSQQSILASYSAHVPFPIRSNRPVASQLPMADLKASTLLHHSSKAGREDGCRACSATTPASGPASAQGPASPRQRPRLPGPAEAPARCCAAPGRAAWEASLQQDAHFVKAMQ